MKRNYFKMMLLPMAAAALVACGGGGSGSGSGSSSAAGGNTASSGGQDVEKILQNAYEVDSDASGSTAEVYGYGKYVPVTGGYRYASFIYNSSSKKYITQPYTDTPPHDYVWSYDTNQWVLDDFGSYVMKVVSNTNSTLTLKYPFGPRLSVRAKTESLQGKDLSSVIHTDRSGGSTASPPNGLVGKKFDATAERYIMQRQNLDAQYLIYTDENVQKPEQVGTFTNFQQVINADYYVMGYDDSTVDGIKINQNNEVIFAEKNSSNVMVETGRGKYVIESAQGGAVQMLRITEMPEQLRRKYWGSATMWPALYIYGNKVVRGTYADTTAEVLDDMQGADINKSALNQILTNLNPPLPAVQ